VCLIHERSKGIPRTVSVICHNALIGGFAMNRRPVTAEVVQEVCEDFDLRGEIADVASPAHLQASPLTESERADAALAAPPPLQSTGAAPTRAGLAGAFTPIRRFFQM
jgi:hypothetical protein